MSKRKSSFPLRSNEKKRVASTFVLQLTLKRSSIQRLWNIELKVKLKIELLIQMYKIIFLFHIKYKNKLKTYNCFGFEPSPIKLDK